MVLPGKRNINEGVKKAYAASIGAVEANVDYPVRCAYCDNVGGIAIDVRPGQRAGWVVIWDLEWDHVYPEHLGGTGDVDNLTLACRPCNRSKGHKDLAEWLCAR